MDENYISLERAIERMYKVTEECGTERIFIDRIIDELENLPSSPNICIHPQWIPVSERLLDWRDGKVLVSTKYGFSICERTVNGRLKGQHANWITHWMPLPEPPKEDN